MRLRSCCTDKLDQPTQKIEKSWSVFLARTNKSEPKNKASTVLTLFTTVRSNGKQDTSTAKSDEALLPYNLLSL